AGGLGSPQPDLGPAVPLGEGQAQHSRRQRGALVQAAAAQRAAEGEPRTVRRRRGVTRLLRIIAPLFVAVGLVAPARAPPPVENFYKGKQINLIVGSGPGGGYAVVARLLARHLGRYVAGNPNIVVQNMPGAGSLRAANYLYSVAPKDGTAIGLVGSDMPLIGLIANNPNVQFDPRKFVWLGSSSSFAGDAYILMVRPDAAAESIREARGRSGPPLVLAGTGEGAATATCRKSCATRSGSISSRCWVIPTRPRSSSRSSAARSMDGPSISPRSSRTGRNGSSPQAASTS